jgi:hypothetical protein
MSIVDPVFTKLMSTDVVTMLEWSLRDATDRNALHQQTIADLLSERDDALDALQNKEHECRAMDGSLKERIAEETLNLRYEFEERLTSRDRTIDEQLHQIAKLELVASHSRAHMRDGSVQAGDAAGCLPSERDQYQRQLAEQSKHFEELLTSERNANSRQRQHWEEVLEARLLMERDLAQRNLETERSKEMAERSRVEAASQRLLHTIQERDERIQSLELSIETLKKERLADQDDFRRTTDTFSQVRRSLEQKLEDAFLQHSDDRRNHQVEMERAMNDQNDTFERMLHEERAQRKRVEEELGLLRSDRSRVMAEHRDELKNVEAKLTATQVELTKSMERLAEIELSSSSSKQILATKEREIKDKCARWEEMAITATHDRSEAQTRIADLEEQLAQAKQDQQKHGAVHELEHKLEVLREQHRAQIIELERRHAGVLDEIRRTSSSESLQHASKAELQVRDAQARAQQFEKALGQAFTERDAAQRESSSTKRQLRDLQLAFDELMTKMDTAAAVVPKRSMVSSTQTDPSSPRGGGGTVASDNEESFTLREQLMRMNQTVWALQLKLQQSEEDIGFLEDTINRMHSEEGGGGRSNTQLRPTPAIGANASQSSPQSLVRGRSTGEGGPSPLRDDERSEAHALFTYFRQ